MENPKNTGRIQMERFIPVEIFRKKSNTFRGITFFLFEQLMDRKLLPTARILSTFETRISLLYQASVCDS